jgi:hypothetical protein
MVCRHGPAAKAYRSGWRGQHPCVCTEADNACLNCRVNGLPFPPCPDARNGHQPVNECTDGGDQALRRCNQAGGSCLDSVGGYLCVAQSAGTRARNFGLVCVPGTRSTISNSSARSSGWLAECRAVSTLSTPVRPCALRAQAQQAMDACCGHRRQRRRRLQGTHAAAASTATQCPLPASCPSLSCAKVFGRFLGNCRIAMTRARLPLAEFERFGRQCRQLIAQAQG